MLIDETEESAGKTCAGQVTGSKEKEQDDAPHKSRRPPASSKRYASRGMDHILTVGHCCNLLVCESCNIKACDSSIFGIRLDHETEPTDPDEGGSSSSLS